VDKPGCPPEWTNVRKSKSHRQADSDESEDASTECKEAGRARDGIFKDNDEREEDDVDKEDDKESKGKDRGNNPDNEEDAELALLRQEMDALEHRMCSKGTVASVLHARSPKPSWQEKPLGKMMLQPWRPFLRGVKTSTHAQWQRHWN
jgi:hypothetical protein